MRIVHFFHRQDSMVGQYVDVLCHAMEKYAEVDSCHSVGNFRHILRERQPDVLHIHGCWHSSFAIAARLAARYNVRFVLSPHGQLEPWIIRQHYLKEKLPRLVAYQRWMVKHAYALIAMGRMEEGCLGRLKWNPRCETVLNSQITEALTAEQMGTAMCRVYRKVLDSDLWPLMDDATRLAVRGFIKAGQTGDSRWLSNEEYEACKEATADDMRKIVLYSYQEGILDTVKCGISVVDKPMPEIDPPSVPCYYPKGKSTADIAPLNCEGNGDEEHLYKLFRSSHKLMRRHKLTISHAVTLSAALRASKADEGKLAERLKEKSLLSYTGRLMQVLSDLTGLEEGFMPVKTIKGYRTTRIEVTITKHLEL